MKNEDQVNAGETVYETLENETDLYVALDDRNERAGVKFNDHELIGAWCRVTCGKRSGEGIVEVTLRDEDEVKELPLAEVKDYILERYNA